jgi:hypothetical protein
MSNCMEDSLVGLSRVFRFGFIFLNVLKNTQALSYCHLLLPNTGLYSKDRVGNVLENNDNKISLFV